MAEDKYLKALCEELGIEYAKGKALKKLIAYSVNRVGKGEFDVEDLESMTDEDGFVDLTDEQYDYLRLNNRDLAEKIATENFRIVCERQQKEYQAKEKDEKELSDLCANALQNVGYKQTLENKHVGKYEVVLNDVVNGDIRIVVVAKEKEEKKYVFASDGASWYILSFPIMRYHQEIGEFASKVLDKEIKVLKGGFMKLEDGKLKLCGRSGQFGEVDHDRVAGFINKAGLDAVVDE